MDAFTVKVSTLKYPSQGAHNKKKNINPTLTTTSEASSRACNTHKLIFRPWGLRDNSGNRIVKRDKRVKLRKWLHKSMSDKYYY
jgi:hypothetical protein